MGVRAVILNEKAYRLLLKLPFFLLIHALVNISVFYLCATEEYMAYSFLLLPMFALTAMARESDAGKDFLIVGSLLVVAIFIIIINMLTADIYFKYIMIGAYFPLMLYSLLVSGNPHSPLRFVIWAGIMASVYTLSLLLNSRALSALCLAYVLTVLLLSLICEQMKRMNMLLHSRRMRRSTPKVIIRLILHNYKWLIALILTVAAVSAVAMLPEYPPPNIGLDVQPSARVLPTPRSIDSLQLDYLGEMGNSQEEGAIIMEKWETELSEEDIQNDPVNIFFAAVMAAFAALLAIGFVLILRMNKSYTIEPLETAQEEIIIIEDCPDDETGKKIRNNNERNTNSIVRKLFRKKVKEHRKKDRLDIHTGHTARNITEMIVATEDIWALDGMYHKARYSGAEVSREELERYNQSRKAAHTPHEKQGADKT